MRVAIVNISDAFGGASRAVYRLFKGLRMRGVDARMIVKRKETMDPNVIPISLPKEEMQQVEQAFARIQNNYIKNNRSSLSNSAFTFPYPGFDLSRCGVMEQFDVINLHNVRGFQSVETISRLLNMEKPVVWTLHDQNAFTGGCHYSAGCRGYENECLDCPQLRDNRYQIPFHVLGNKLKHWVKNLTVVAPSRWMARCAKDSRVLGHFKVDAVLNSVETDVFRPVSKAEAKGALGLDAANFVVLYNALHHVVKRKGFSEFVEAIECCLQDPRFKECIDKGTIRFLTVGLTARDAPRVPVPLFSYGRVDSDEFLATIFGASDVYVLPSLEDNLPNTMLEAMACGTPVIAFDVGGIPEVVKNEENGYIVPKGNANMMARAILEIISRQDLARAMGRNAMRSAQEEFALEVQGERYRQLFGSLMEDSSDCAKNTRCRNMDTEYPHSIEVVKSGQEIDREFRRNLRDVFDEEGLT